MFSLSQTGVDIQETEQMDMSVSRVLSEPHVLAAILLIFTDSRLNLSK